MRRRDFLKGLAAVCGAGLVAAPAVAKKGPYDEQLARYLKAAPPMDVETLDASWHEGPLRPDLIHKTGPKFSLPCSKEAEFAEIFMPSVYRRRPS